MGPSCGNQDIAGLQALGLVQAGDYARYAPRDAAGRTEALEHVRLLARLDAQPRKWRMALRMSGGAFDMLGAVPRKFGGISFSLARQVFFAVVDDVD